MTKSGETGYNKMCSFKHSVFIKSVVTFLQVFQEVFVVSAFLFSHTSPTLHEAKNHLMP